MPVTPVIFLMIAKKISVATAVIGGADRWRRRLEGLAEQMRVAQTELEPDDPALEHQRRDAATLAQLSDFALPLIDALDALPGAASWGAWLDQLSALASRALQRPERVQSVLAELAPMRDVGSRSDRKASRDRAIRRGPGPASAARPSGPWV